MSQHVIDLTLSSDDEAPPAPPMPKRARTAPAGGDSDSEVVIVEPAAAAAQGPMDFGGGAGGGDGDADVVVTAMTGVVRAPGRGWRQGACRALGRAFVPWGPLGQAPTLPIRALAVLSRLAGAALARC